MSDKKVSQLTAKATLDGTELVHVVSDPGGTPVDRKATAQAIADLVTVPTVPALASQAEAEAGVENTKIMTALRTAQAIAALGAKGLTAYQNIVVVDAGGNGDYATLSAAIAGVTAAGTIYLIFGNTTEPSGTLTINRNCKIIGFGSTITKASGAISIAPGYVVEILGDLTITCTTLSNTGDLTISCKILGKVTFLTGDGNPAYLRLTPTASIINSSGVAIDLIDSGIVPEVAVLDIRGAKIVSNIGVGIDVGSSTGMSQLDVVNSLIVGAYISGVGDAIASDIAISPKVYQCLLINGVHANVTLPGGGGNVSV